MTITGRTTVAGVVGHPVRHSLSPVIHNAGFASLGMDWVYGAFDLAPGAASDGLAAMRALGIRGLSVTMPHKTEMARLVDEVSAAASRLESVNTLTLEDSGRIRGDSTDGDGLVSSLRVVDIDVVGRRVVLLGAGGAARSVLDSLLRHGVARVDIVNRTAAAAERAAALDPQRCAVVDSTSVAEAVLAGELVINATSVGMNRSPDDPAASPIEGDWLTADHVVVDLVYHPLETALLRGAAQRGCRTVDGLGMLIHQAALQQQIWTGRFPDVGVMTAAARAALVSPGPQ
ncbi:MAG: shikimate dehydrogenase [Actinomycetota bacterium]